MSIEVKANKKYPMESKFIPFAEYKAKKRFYEDIEAKLYRDPEYREFFLNVLKRLSDEDK